MMAQVLGGVRRNRFWFGRGCLANDIKDARASYWLRQQLTMMTQMMFGSAL